MTTTPELWNQARPLDERARQVTGWLSEAEQHFLHWYMAEGYTGQGAAVELDCFLGRSTAAMLDGLSHNPHPAAQGQKLHVYDNFVWEPMYKHVLAGQNIPNIPDYASFEPALLQNLKPWQDHLQTHPGDISHPVWEGGPVEFLFVDVMKSWEAAAGVIQTFYPHLMPGLGLVVQQDYKHYNTPWIQLTSYRLREHLQPLYSLENACSVVFKCVRPITPAECAHACDYASFSVNEINAAFDLANEIVRQDVPFWADQIDAARQMAFVHYAAMNSPEIQQKALQFDDLKRIVATLFEMDAPRFGEAPTPTTPQAPHNPEWLAQHIPWRALQRALLLKLTRRLR